MVAQEEDALLAFEIDRLVSLEPAQSCDWYLPCADVFEISLCIHGKVWRGVSEITERSFRQYSKIKHSMRTGAPFDVESHRARRLP